MMRKGRVMVIFWLSLCDDAETGKKISHRRRMNILETPDRKINTSGKGSFNVTSQNNTGLLTGLPTRRLTDDVWNN